MEIGVTNDIFDNEKMKPCAEKDTDCVAVSAEGRDVNENLTKYPPYVHPRSFEETYLKEQMASKLKLTYKIKNTDGVEKDTLQNLKYKLDVLNMADRIHNVAQLQELGVRYNVKFTKAELKKGLKELKQVLAERLVNPKVVLKNYMWFLGKPRVRKAMKTKRRLCIKK